VGVGEGDGHETVAFGPPVLTEFLGLANCCDRICWLLKPPFVKLMSKFCANEAKLESKSPFNKLPLPLPCCAVDDEFELDDACELFIIPPAASIGVSVGA